MAAKMTDELELVYMSYASYTDIIELDTKEKSKRKFWTQEWLLKGTKEELIIEFQMSSD